MKTVWMVVNAAGVIVFSAFAFLQRNDIDPERYYHPSVLDAILWICFYGLIAALFAFALRRKFSLWVLGAAAVFCLIEMITTFPGIVRNLKADSGFVLTGSQMSAETPWVELSREFFGAAIALAATVLLWIERAWWRRVGARERSSYAAAHERTAD